MTRPRDWYEMTDEARREWQRAESERSNLEYEREQSERRAEQAHRDAQRAQEAAKAARYDYEEQAESYRSEIEELNERLTEVRLDRDALIEACDDVLAWLKVGTLSDPSGAIRVLSEVLAKVKA